MSYKPPIVTVPPKTEKKRPRLKELSTGVPFRFVEGAYTDVLMMRKADGFFSLQTGYSYTFSAHNISVWDSEVIPLNVEIIVHGEQ